MIGVYHDTRISSSSFSLLLRSPFSSSVLWPSRDHISSIPLNDPSCCAPGLEDTRSLSTMSLLHYLLHSLSICLALAAPLDPVTLAASSAIAMSTACGDIVNSCSTPMLLGWPSSDDDWWLILFRRQHIHSQASIRLSH